MYDTLFDMMSPQAQAQLHDTCYWLSDPEVTPNLKDLKIETGYGVNPQVSGCPESKRKISIHVACR